MTLNVIDVGASIGLFGNFIADQSVMKNGIHSISVICVEPIPEIAAKIVERNNLKVIPKAIVDFDLIPSDGIKNFNLTSNSELSSFLEINPEIDEHLWRFHLPSLVIEKQIPVNCTTLEKIIQDSAWERVDFIKIDTQGTDLEVLLSAKKEMNKIVACVLEFPYFNSSAIYDGEKSLIKGIEILGNFEFIPVRIVPNGAGECNVFFLNSNYSIEDYFEIEEMLQFHKAPTLKIGPHDPLINLGLTKRIKIRSIDKVKSIYVRFIKHRVYKK
jgi:FkbM family methyltransferase